MKTNKYFGSSLAALAAGVTLVFNHDVRRALRRQSMHSPRTPFSMSSAVVRAPRSATCSTRGRPSWFQRGLHRAPQDA